MNHTHPSKSLFTEEDLTPRKREWFAIIADRIYSYGEDGFEQCYLFAKYWGGKARYATLAKIMEEFPRLFLQS